MNKQRVKDLKKASKKLEKAFSNFKKDPEKYSDQLDEAIDYVDSITDSPLDKVEKFFKSIFN